MVKELSFLSICTVTVLVLFFKEANSQDACERLTISDLGSPDMLSTEGLLSESLSPQRQGGANVVSVRVLNINIVCEAQQMMRDRYRYTSVVVSYNCLSGDIRVPQCSNSSVIFTEQFDFGCIGGQWSPTILTISNQARTQNPLATLTTGRDTDCILCINPDHPAAPSTVDVVTHCVECTNCTMGLQRCFIDNNNNEVCCNFFSGGVCVTECPSPLVPNTNFECGCSELSDPNGVFQYSNGQSIGSTATLTCNTSFVPSGANPVTCQTSGWTGMPTCEPVCGDLIPNCVNCTVTGQTVMCTECPAPEYVLMNGNCILTIVIAMTTIPVQSAVSEAERMVQVCVAVMPPPGPATMIIADVLLSTQDGSALAGSDYTALSMTVTINTVSNTRPCVTIPVAVDGILEDTEEFTVSAQVTNFSVNGVDMLPMAPNVEPNPITIGIRDNTIVTLGFASDEYTFDEDSPNNMVCVVLIDGEIERTSRDVIATLTAIPGTAIEGSDYSPISMIVRLNRNTPPEGACVTIPIIPDGVLEEDEEFTLSLDSMIPDTRIDDMLNGTDITIRNDDSVTVGFQNESYIFLEGQSNTDQTVCVEIMNGELGDSFELVVGVQTLTGTAEVGADYLLPMNNMLLFSGSTTVRCLPLTIVDDSETENIENITVMILSDMFGNYVIMSGVATIFIEDDDQVTTTPTLPATTTEQPTTTEEPTEPETTTVMTTTIMTTEATTPEQTTVSPTTPPVTTQATTPTMTTTEAATTTELLTTMPPTTPASTTVATTPMPTTPDIVQCPMLLGPTNGFVWLTSRLVDTTATYKCLTGYKLSGGTSVRTCLPDGTWSGSAPRCVGVTCPPLYWPRRSYIFFTRGNTVVSSAYYYCATGYYLCGNRRRVCRPNGRWTGTTPQCLKWPRRRRCY